MNYKIRTVVLLGIILVIFLFNIGIKDFIINKIDEKSIQYTQIDMDFSSAAYKNLSVQNNSIQQLKARSGEDSNIIFQLRSPEHIKAVSLHIQVEQADKIQLFYLVDGEADFSENNSIVLDLKKGGNNIKFNIPDNVKVKRINSLRLDPVNEEQTITIDNMKLNN